jgi:hypothetical protein
LEDFSRIGELIPGRRLRDPGRHRQHLAEELAAVFDGDECLWNVLQDILKGEGYTVIEVCNDYEGLAQDHARLVMALPPQDTRHLIAF